jgi:glycosyltransferase involved in cell wall biosynthesis/GR25 family glycosyltransferase involved in LPS biosynthesis
MKFLSKSYRTYSVKWLIQRVIIVIKEGRFPQIGFVDAFKNMIFMSGSEKKLPSSSGKDIFEREIPPISYIEIKIPEAEKNAHLINNYFDCIYLLNLNHRTEKRLKSIFLLKKLGIKAKIVDAVNGSLSPYKDDYERYMMIPLGEKYAHPLEKELKRKMITSPGAWGVLMSEKVIFTDALKNNYKRILILEDDMIFIKDFHNRFSSFINEIDDDWKIIALGATQHTWFFPGSLFYKDPSINAYDKDQKFYYPMRTDGAFALGFDHSVFQYILDQTGKMNCAFDSGPVRAAYKKYKTKCFVCQPNLIIADVSTSDIRCGRNQEDFSRKMNWDLKLYDQNTYDELVSVIMPAYNAERTIEKSIRSVLMQTYKNLELIIVDDGSTDKTESIVREIATEDHRIIFQRNDQNKGCYFVRNDALRLSKGKYIAIQDADDISLNNRLEKQLIPLVSGNALVSFSLFIRSRCSIEELDLLNQAEMIELVNIRRVKVNGKYEYLDRPNLALATSVFKRELFEKYGLFWESRFSADAEFLERIFYHEFGISFNHPNGNVHSFISKEKKKQDAFILLDELLYISPEMAETNLSKKYEINGQLRNEYVENYRARLSGEFVYQYPSFKE